MAMILRSLLILIFCLPAFGSEIENLFKAKKHPEIVAKYYSKTGLDKLSTREMTLLSYSLKALKKYREDSRVVLKRIMRDYKQEHIAIRRHIKNKETLDAEDYPKSMPVLYWQLYNDYAQIILGHKKLGHSLDKDKVFYDTIRQILSELEFREGKVEKINDKVMGHLQHLQDKVYRFSASWNIQYVSWQHSANLQRASTGEKTGLILTNKGYCVGGDVGYENGFYHFNLDGCFLFGSGGVSAYGDPNITYEQNLPATGVKLGPTASMIVSSTKARVGIGLPLIYTSQKLTNPSDQDYSIKEKSPLAALATINSRWQFDKWYMRVEFGQYFGEQESFWGLGIGRQF